MRKITLFIVSLFLTIGAMAQFDATKEYRIKAVSNGQYLTIGDSNGNAYGHVYGSTLDENNGDQKFSFIASDTKWKIKSANNEYFTYTGSGAGWNVNATTDENSALEMTFESTGTLNEYYIKCYNDAKKQTNILSGNMFLHQENTTHLMTLIAELSFWSRKLV